MEPPWHRHWMLCPTGFVAEGLVDESFDQANVLVGEWQSALSELVLDCV